MPLEGDRKREYQRLWIKNRKREWIAEHSPCACGSTRRLEVHHCDPLKKVSHRVWSWAKERREQELHKCVVLCAKCHKKATAEQKIRPHGTFSRYNEHLCRCALCRAANAAHTRRHRERVRRLGNRKERVSLPVP